MAFVPWAVSGIDVSRWQGEIDWPAVADRGYKFAGIRASVGDYYTDPTFEFNFDGAITNGIIPLPYHVIRPDIDVPGNVGRFEQALNGREAPGYVLDAELHGGASREKVRERTYWMLEAMKETMSGRWDPDPEILVYTADWFWSPWIGEGKTDELASGWPAEYDLWVANYHWPTVQAPVLPIGWRERALWSVWQHTDRGQVPGIQAAVDLNFMKFELYQKLGGDPDEGPPMPGPGEPIKITLEVPEGMVEVKIKEI